MSEGRMRSHFVLLLKLVITVSAMLILILPIVNAADINHISEIGEPHVGKEVTISGTIISVTPITSRRITFKRTSRERHIKKLFSSLYTTTK